MSRIVVAICVAGSLAHADDPTALVARGQELAKAGEFSRAIAIFKQADAIKPTAENACLIGLVYTRRELWSQAELFFDACKHRTTEADPLPDWLPAAEEQLAQKLAETDAAPIEVRVDPADARISVSSWPPDESFVARTIHLAPGSYVITATAPGREAVHAQLVVESRVGQIINLVLPRPPPPPLPPPPPPTRAETIGTYLLVGAGGLVLAGAAFHGWTAYERTQVAAAHDDGDPVAWDRHASRFETLRLTTLTCYGVAIASGVVGIVLRRHHREAPSRVQITAGATPGAAMIGIAWRR